MISLFVILQSNKLKYLSPSTLLKSCQVYLNIDVVKNNPETLTVVVLDELGLAGECVELGDWRKILRKSSSDFYGSCQLRDCLNFKYVRL